MAICWRDRNDEKQTTGKLLYTRQIRKNMDNYSYICFAFLGFVRSYKTSYNFLYNITIKKDFT